MTSLRIDPEGTFSLSAAASFGFGPQMARPKPVGDTMALAFVTDDLRMQAGVHLRQAASGEIEGEVWGDAAADAVRAQVMRILSLDRSGADWLEVGSRDPVIGRLQEQLPGLRPVLFHSPYEAAAWAVISQRRHRSQAADLRRRLATALGRVFELPDGPLEAFPTPAALLELREFPGMGARRIERLHGVAQAALDGRLEPELLTGMSPDEALRQLQRIPGIGPMYAGLILLRSTGAADIATLQEPRLAGYVQHFYELEARPGAAALAQISDGWRPFRTWAGVLIRVAGDREGLTGQE